MLVYLAFACLVVAQPAQSEASKAEVRKLQGTWNIELQDEGGKTLPEAEVKSRTITFGMNLFLIRNKAGLVQLGKVKLDPAKKTFNATVEKGQREGDLLPGIYEMEGDTLRIALSIDGEVRPKDFKRASDRMILVCKRVPVKADERDLSGKYESLSVDISGKQLRYDTTIERVGDSYLVLYTIQGKLVYFGTGIRRGNTFALSWTSQGRPGITLYQIEANNRLVGEFAEVGGPGFLGTETLTPVPKEANSARAE